MIEQTKKQVGAKIGHIVSEITREKIRNSYYHTHQKGNAKMPIKKGDKLEIIFGKEKADDIKKRISKTMKERHIIPVNLLKKGYKQTELTKKKLSLYHTGLKQSPETIQKLLKTRKENGHWYASEETKQKMRISAIKNIKEYRGFTAPAVGRYEKEILDKLQDYIGSSIKRAFYINGYYLDGYCSDLNLAIEIDEEHHFKNDILIKKDLLKQDNITKALNCKFLRIRVKDYLKSKLIEIDSSIYRGGI
jgi:very-short-patch-repair endonuclease